MTTSKEKDRMSKDSHTPLALLDDWVKKLEAKQYGDRHYLIGLVRGHIENLKVVEQRAIEQAYVAGATSSETPEQYYIRKYKK